MKHNTWNCSPSRWGMIVPSWIIQLGVLDGKELVLEGVIEIALLEVVANPASNDEMFWLGAGPPGLNIDDEMEMKSEDIPFVLDEVML